MRGARCAWVVGVVLAAGVLLLPARLSAGHACGPCACTHLWSGIYPLALLPWGCDCAVDEASLEAQLRYQLAGGVSGVLVLGSIGEGEYAHFEVRAQMLRATARVVNGCVPIIAGIHTCDIEVAKAQLLQAKELGASAVLVKYKGNPKARGCEVLAFYQCLSDLAALPIFYYHYPSDTRLKLTPAQIASVLKLPGVAGAKISTLDLKEFEEIVALTRGCGKAYFTGTALNLTQFLDAGGHGAMCPEAALLPGQTVCAYRAYCQGRSSAARDAQKELFVLAPLLRGGLATEQASRKKVMVTQDLGLRLPLQDHRPQARLKAALDGLGVPTSSRVSCQLPGLSAHDRVVVDRVVAKVRSRHLSAASP
jgi:4-hydroxy-tetrahydrodipicolinate synthase